jgi:hypothetical protein
MGVGTSAACLMPEGVHSALGLEYKGVRDVRPRTPKTPNVPPGLQELAIFGGLRYLHG